jgi:nucleoside-diphosphate-sugar epimerase
MIEKLNTRTTRFIIDGVIVGISLYLAYLTRYDGRVPQQQQRQFFLVVVPIIIGRLAFQLLFGVHKHRWRYVSILEGIQIAQAYAAFSLLLLTLRLALPSDSHFDLFRLPIGVIAIEFMTSLMGTIGARVLRRLTHQHTHDARKGDSSRRIVLVGAGIHGTAVANEMVPNRKTRVVGFVDDDRRKIGAVIAGVPVLGPVSSLPQVVEKYKVDEILICIPPAARGRLKVELPERMSLHTRIVPTLDEILSTATGLLSVSERTTPPKLPGATGLALPKDEHPSTSIRNKTILITGGAGFIGSSLAEILAKDNEVVLVDVAFREKPIEFTRLLNRPNVRTVEGSLLDGIDIRGLCRETDMVVHAAAVVGVNKVCASGRETLETNYAGTSRVLEALEGNKKLQRLIYFSSSEVFGVNSFRVDENTPPRVGPIAEARWSYAVAKLAGEHLVKAYFRETGMPTTIVRPFNVFGPRRTGDHALLQFILNALSGKPLEIHGDGSQIRSWCYINDFCSGLLRMLERPEAVGEDFNIGNAANTLTIYRLAQKVVELCGTDAPINFVEHPCPDVSIRVPSSTKAQTLLGYKPRYDLDSALQLTIGWYRENLGFFVRDADTVAVH